MPLPSSRTHSVMSPLSARELDARSSSAAPCLIALARASWAMRKRWRRDGRVVDAPGGRRIPSCSATCVAAGHIGGQSRGARRQARCLSLSPGTSPRASVRASSAQSAHHVAPISSAAPAPRGLDLARFACADHRRESAAPKRLWQRPSCISRPKCLRSRSLIASTCRSAWRRREISRATTSTAGGGFMMEAPREHFHVHGSCRRAGARCASIGPPRYRRKRFEQRAQSKPRR